MLHWLQSLHSAAGISRIIQTGGLLALAGIIFSETGLLVGLFLPGDSLLITAGVLANPANPSHIGALDIMTLNLVLVAAAVIGNQTGFFLGHKTGDSIWDRANGRFYKREHLETAHRFYEKHGGFSVLAARYVPIVRTFVPFVAGLARMPYRNFVFWDIAGGILWISSVLWAGYFLGQTPLANRLDKIILVVIVVSLLPMAIGAVRRWLGRETAGDRII